MDRLAQARLNMVESQIRPNDVTDRRILGAMSAIPRENFVPVAKRSIAYVDEELELNVSEGYPRRWLLSPMHFAKLLQLANVQNTDIVLDVGCTTGYSTAIISQIAESVVAVENDPELLAAAESNLSALEVTNAVAVSGKLSQGFEAEGPYDVVFINGAVSGNIQELQEQLKTGGRMVLVDNQTSPGTAFIYTRNDTIISRRASFDAIVSPMPGFQTIPEFVF